MSFITKSQKMDDSEQAKVESHFKEKMQIMRRNLMTPEYQRCNESYLQADSTSKMRSNFDTNKSYSAQKPKQKITMYKR